MAIAPDCCVKTLHGAEFDAGTGGREGKSDVTGDGKSGGGGFGWVAVAGGGDLYSWDAGEVSRSSVEA